MFSNIVLIERGQIINLHLYNHLKKLVILSIVGLGFLTSITGCDEILHAKPVPEGLTIAEIQGSGHFSPFTGLKVENVHGIVTVVRAAGFYMQSVHPDDDPATSEGIYVYTRLIPSVRPGDEVLVSAEVVEWVPDAIYPASLTVTQLSYPQVENLARRQPLPAPVVIGLDGRMPPSRLIASPSHLSEEIFDPEVYGLDFYESLEGMLVQVNNAVVVGATNPYKEIVILPDRGDWAGIRTPNGGIVIREDDFNPERIILDDGLRALPFVQVGDFSNQPIIGVIDYAFGNYRLVTVENVAFLPGGLQPTASLAPTAPGFLRVGSYNIENLTALHATRIEELADQIVNLFASPDIIGLQEVMDNDGIAGDFTAAADQTYEGIINAIAEKGGPPYGYLNIDPLPNQDGGVPDGNIRVGYLYRLDTGLTLLEAPHGDADTAVEVWQENGLPVISHNPGRVEPNHDAFVNSRKPLAAGFVYLGEPLFVVNNHFISKQGDTPLFGAVQPPSLNSETKRLEQSKVVYEFVEKILTLNPHSHVIVLGDLNDFYFSAPLQTLKGDILINLVETMPFEDRYSYNYQGNSQVLDHILVSQSLAGRVESFEFMRINSEFDYLRQFSDHDPVFVTLDFNQ